MTRDYNAIAMNKTSQSKPSPSGTGNLRELQWASFSCLCPHHPTCLIPKFEMKPPQSFIPGTGPLTSFLPILRAHLPSALGILGEEGWPANKCITLRTRGFSGRLTRTPTAARMESPREWQAQSSPCSRTPSHARKWKLTY